MDQRIVAALEQSIQAAPGSLSPDRALGELGGWDSMGMVSLVGEVYELFRVELSVDQLAGCRTVADLVSLVRDRAGPAGTPHD